MRRRAGKPPAWLAPDAPAGIDRRRQVVGVLLAAAVLPLLTAGLALGRHHLSLDDDLLIYLVAVVAIAIAGRFWPAVLAAIAASLLLNWFSHRRCTPSRSTSRRISWRCCCTSRSP
jgi:K+-sensing histidine kinase KdpD